MSKVFHKELAEGRWFQMSLAEQIGNAGSEVNRAITHLEKERKDSAINAFYRSLELLDLTIADPKNKYRLKELCRLREVLCDVFAGDNAYNTPTDYLKKYFYHFGYLARRKKENEHV